MIRADYYGDTSFYPASLVKLFFMVETYHQGHITPEIERALREMIQASDNDAAAFLLDALTDTASGSELKGKALDESIDRRRKLNRYFSSLSYDTSAMMKSWSFGSFRTRHADHGRRVLGQQGKYDEAVQYFTEALRIDSDYFDALINMGFTLYDQGKPAEAISYYRRALEIKPDSAKAHMQLALALVKQGKGDEALQQFYKAQELAPSDADIRTNLGLMLARQGKLSEATAQLNEALRLNPTSAEAHNNLGLIFLLAVQPEKSLPHFATALDRKPNFTIARDNLRRAQSQIDARQK